MSRLMYDCCGNHFWGRCFSQDEPRVELASAE